MHTKPYVITSYSWTQGVDQYFRSMDKNLGDSVDPVAFVFGKTTVEEFHPKNAAIFRVGSSYPGNTGRFLPLYDLRQSFDPNRWWIFTDTHDVVFQTQLPNLDTLNAEILVCDEGKKFGEIGFWKDRVPRALLDKPAYNVGSFAMKGYVFIEFLQYLVSRYEWISKRNINDFGFFPDNTAIVKHFVSGFFNQYADTILFNEFLAKHKFAEHPTLFTCLAFHLETGRAIMKDHRYFTKNGALYSIAHANGGFK